MRIFQQNASMICALQQLCYYPKLQAIFTQILQYFIEGVVLVAKADQ